MADAPTRPFVTGEGESLELPVDTNHSLAKKLESFRSSNTPLKAGKSWSRPNRNALQSKDGGIGTVATTTATTTTHQEPPPSESAHISNTAIPDSVPALAISAASNSAMGSDPTKRPSKHVSHTGSSDFDLDKIYDRNINYRYMPLEMASSPSVKGSIAKSILYKTLGRGLVMIKHGRQGAPKKRMLFCDPGVTKLYWTSNLSERHEVSDEIPSFPPTGSEPAESGARGEDPAGGKGEIDGRSINVADILEIRLGTELDPDTPVGALQAAANAGVQEAVVMLEEQEQERKAPDNYTLASSGTHARAGFEAGSGSEPPAAVPTMQKRRSVKDAIRLFSSRTVHESNSKEFGLLYGTPTLRRKCRPKDYAMCLSLILPDRSLDIQCFEKKDLTMLHVNLKEVLTNLRGSDSGGGRSGGLSPSMQSAGAATCSPDFSAASPLQRSSQAQAQSRTHQSTLQNDPALVAPTAAGSGSSAGGDRNEDSKAGDDAAVAAHSQSGTEFDMYQHYPHSHSNSNIDLRLGLGFAARSGSNINLVSNPMKAAAAERMSQKLSFRKSVRWSADESGMDEASIRLAGSAKLSPRGEPISIMRSPQHPQRDAALMLNSTSNSSLSQNASSAAAGAGGDRIEVVAAHSFDERTDLLPLSPRIDLIPGAGAGTGTGNRSAAESRDTEGYEVDDVSQASSSLAQMRVGTVGTVDSIDPDGTTTCRVFQYSEGADMDRLLDRDYTGLSDKHPSRTGQPSGQAPGALAQTMAPVDGSGKDGIGAAVGSTASPDQTAAAPATVGDAASATGAAERKQALARKKSPFQMSAHEALQIGLILSQQEAEHGTNMYQSLRPEDEPLLEQLIADGLTTEESILQIFQRKFIPELFAAADGNSAELIPGQQGQQGNDFNCAGSEERVVQGRSITVGGGGGGSASTGSGGASPQPRPLAQVGRPSSFFPQIYNADSKGERGADNNDVDKASNSQSSSDDGESYSDFESDGNSNSGDHGVDKGDGQDRAKVGDDADAAADAAAESRSTAKQGNIVEDEEGKVKGDGSEVGEEEECSPTMSSITMSRGNTYSREGLSYTDADAADASIADAATASANAPVPAGMRLQQSFNPSLRRSASRGEMSREEGGGEGGGGGEGRPLLRMSSTDAMQIGLMLSQQEAEYGTNMYESLQEEDEDWIQDLVVRQGLSTDEAVLEIFNCRFGVVSRRRRAYNRGPDYSMGMGPTAMAEAAGLHAPAGAGNLKGPFQPHSSTAYNGYPPGHTGGPPTAGGSGGAQYLPLQYQQGPRPYPDQVPHSHLFPDGQYPQHTQHTQQHQQYPSYQQYPQQQQHSPLQRKLSDSSFFPNDPTDVGIFNERAVHNRSRSGLIGSFYPSNTASGGAGGAGGSDHGQGTGFGHQPGALDPRQQEQRPGMRTVINPRNVSLRHSLTALSDEDALQLAMLLSQQEDEFGVNMYDALRPEDENHLQFLISQGLTNEEAIMRIFERNYVSRRRGGPPPPPPPAAAGMGMGINPVPGGAVHNRAAPSSMPPQQLQQLTSPAPTSAPAAVLPARHPGQATHGQATHGQATHGQATHGQASQGQGPPAGLPVERHPTPHIYGSNVGPHYRHVPYNPHQSHSQPQTDSHLLTSSTSASHEEGEEGTGSPPIAPVVALIASHSSDEGAPPVLATATLATTATGLASASRPGLQQHQQQHRPPSQTVSALTADYSSSSSAAMLSRSDSGSQRSAGLHRAVSGSTGVAAAAIASAAQAEDSRRAVAAGRSRGRHGGSSRGGGSGSSSSRRRESGGGSNKRGSSSSTTTTAGPAAGSAAGSAAASAGGNDKSLRPKRSIFNFSFKRRDSRGSRSGLEGHLSAKLKYKSRDVKAIMEMGFTKDQAIWALVENDNNVLQAINSLAR